LNDNRRIGVVRITSIMFILSKAVVVVDPFAREAVAVLVALTGAGMRDATYRREPL
jgi:hypothetical protein